MATSNAVNLKDQGVAYVSSTGAFSGIDASTSGKVLTSNGTGVAPSFQTPAPGGIVTINGDSGSITGTTVTLYANTAAQNAGSTVKFVNSGTTSTLNVTDALQNTIIGNGAGNATISSTYNTCLGYGTGNSLTSGEGANTLIGFNVGRSITTGNNNIGVGQSSLATLTTGLANVAIRGLPFLTTGSYNVAVGTQDVGWRYTTESSNILINSVGEVGDNNTMRLGRHGSNPAEVNRCFIAGINGVTTSNSLMVTIDSSTNQLGTATIPTGVSPFTEITSATQTCSVNNGYITNRGGGVVYTLPASGAIGDVIKFVGKSGIAVITPNTGQQICIGGSSGLTGATGTATANNLGDCLDLVCITAGASAVWRANSMIGTWTLVTS